jgi:hypothetical protein
MKINSENCEAWFLDYYEGNLSKEGVEELFAFLALNPEMHELFDSYDEVSFAPEKEIRFDWKSELKKPEDVQAGINESNYEEYFVSYAEGLLSADGKAEVEKFLVQFPAKREELELLQHAILIPDEEIVFEGKETLHRSILITQENFDEVAIASVEGLLNVEEQKAFTASLTGNVEQQKSYELFKQTKLSADASIVFEDKESLKRKDRGAFWWMFDTRFAAAAAVVLLMGIFYWNYSGNETVVKNDSEIAAVDTGKTNSPILPSNSGSNSIANTVDHTDTAPKTVIDHTPRKNQLANAKENVREVIPPVKIDAQPREFIPAAETNTSLSVAAANPQVDFSDAYYSYAHYTSPAPVASSGRTSISPQQAAMRWMKKKLDRTPAKNADEEIYIAAAPTGTNGNVSGFDLTSSAISALGNATGSNLRLGQEPQGTVLTVGKYELLLNRNN